MFLLKYFIYFSEILKKKNKSNVIPQTFKILFSRFPFLFEMISIIPSVSPKGRDVFVVPTYNNSRFLIYEISQRTAQQHCIREEGNLIMSRKPR